MSGSRVVVTGREFQVLFDTRVQETCGKGPSVDRRDIWRVRERE